MDLCASKFSSQPYRFDAFCNALWAFLDLVVLDDMQTLRYVWERFAAASALRCSSRRLLAASFLRCADRVKHGHARTVYVSTRLQEELRSYINSRKWHEDTQPLFTTYSSPRKAFTPSVLSQHFYWLFKAAGIKGASSHSGGKTFLTTFSDKGVSVFVLASLAGHRNISTTQRYITANDDVKRRAVELV
jgi:integrase